jgi:hypothetical protein
MGKSDSPVILGTVFGGYSKSKILEIYLVSFWIGCKFLIE